MPGGAQHCTGCGGPVEVCGGICTRALDPPASVRAAGRASRFGSHLPVGQRRAARTARSHPLRERANQSNRAVCRRQPCAHALTAERGPFVSGDVLTARALNRATLERQLLLRRSDKPVLDAVEHLVGMQAQLPLNPYLWLWSWLEGFRADDLAGPLLDREVVRIVVMRATLHLVRPRTAWCCDR